MSDVCLPFHWQFTSMPSESRYEAAREYHQTSSSASRDSTLVEWCVKCFSLVTFSN